MQLVMAMRSQVRASVMLLRMMASSPQVRSQSLMRMSRQPLIIVGRPQRCWGRKTVASEGEGFDCASSTSMFFAICADGRSTRAESLPG